MTINKDSPFRFTQVANSSAPLIHCLVTSWTITSIYLYFLSCPSHLYALLYHKHYLDACHWQLPMLCRLCSAFQVLHKRASPIQHLRGALGWTDRCLKEHNTETNYKNGSSIACTQWWFKKKKKRYNLINSTSTTTSISGMYISSLLLLLAAQAKFQPTFTQHSANPACRSEPPKKKGTPPIFQLPHKASLTTSSESSSPFSQAIQSKRLMQQK